MPKLTQGLDLSSNHSHTDDWRRRDGVNRDEVIVYKRLEILWSRVRLKQKLQPSAAGRSLRRLCRCELPATR